MVAAVHFHLLIDPLGCSPECHFPQRDEIALAEKILERLLCVLRHIDLAVFESLQEIVGREVDQFDVIGLFEH